MTQSDVEADQRDGSGDIDEDGYRGESMGRHFNCQHLHEGVVDFRSHHGGGVGTARMVRVGD